MQRSVLGSSLLHCPERAGYPAAPVYAATLPRMPHGALQGGLCRVRLANDHRRSRTVSGDRGQRDWISVRRSAVRTAHGTGASTGRAVGQAIGTEDGALASTWPSTRTPTSSSTTSSLPAASFRARPTPDVGDVTDVRSRHEAPRSAATSSSSPRCPAQAGAGGRRSDDHPGQAGVLRTPKTA